MRILLKRGDYERMLEHAVSVLPEEACGLIAGVEEEGEGAGDGGMVRRIEKVYLLTNTDHSKEHFSLDPREQLEAVKDMRALHLKPLGNWHSHPESPSRPSAEDIRLAFDKNVSYLILSLAERGKPVLRSFHVENGAGTAEELELI